MIPGGRTWLLTILDCYDQKKLEELEILDEIKDML
jgi:hypothetical protein